MGRKCVAGIVLQCPTTASRSAGVNELLLPVGLQHVRVQMTLDIIL
jgi:hypothetical protein